MPQGFSIVKETEQIRVNKSKKMKIVVVGLGYVGLSNAVKPSEIKINKDGKFVDTMLSPSPLNSNPFSIKRGEPNSAIDTLHMQNKS